MQAGSDGSRVTQLTNEVAEADCSPDGKWIVVASLFGHNDYRIELASGRKVEILKAPGNAAAFDPVISPDGNSVAFIYQEGEPVPLLKIGLVPATGGAYRYVADLPIGSARLRWAPSGSGIQYLLTRDGATNIWEQPIARGAAHQVTHFPNGRIWDFAWSRDGKQIYLAKGSESNDVILISNF